MKSGDDNASLELIEKYRGHHCHEPVIAKVMREAASRKKTKIIRILLDDGVHADVRVKRGDQTAFESAANGVQDNESSEVCHLLYKRGAKVHSIGGSVPWTYWHGIDSNPLDLDAESKKSMPKNSQISGMGTEEFRALIVDIYSPILDKTDINQRNNTDDASKQDGNSIDATSTGNQQNTADNVSKQSGNPIDATPTGNRQNNADNASKQGGNPIDAMPTSNQQNNTDNASKQTNDRKGRSHEIHRIAHPTVKQLIYGDGPDAIMGSPPEKFSSKEEYEHFRWIHIPLNHVS